MTLRSRWWPQKEEVVATHGMVVAKHPLAAEAGLEMLKQGGSAIDAAVATGFALCVVEPMMSCLAGAGFMVIHLARQGQNVAVEYPPRAPKAATPDMYRIMDRPGSGIGIYEVEGAENTDGYRAIAVPGTVVGLCLAHQRFGTLPLQQVLEPAIAYAEEGFAVNWYLALCISNTMDALRRFPGSAAVFLPHGGLAQYTPIWNPWADAQGELGPIYGYQWRQWPQYTLDEPTGQYTTGHIDQMQRATDTIKRHPHSRRIIVSAWNVADLDQMALPPCHLLMQFYVVEGRLDLQVYQRSADLALGVPFNIASYALLLMMVAQECALEPGYFIHTLGDAHIYLNHIEGLTRQLHRTPYPLPHVTIASKPLFDLTFADIALHDYVHHPFIKFPIAV